MTQLTLQQQITKQEIEEVRKQIREQISQQSKTFAYINPNLQSEEDVAIVAELYIAEQKYNKRNFNTRKRAK